jgi:hypothetical protein
MKKNRRDKIKYFLGAAIILSSMAAFSALARVGNADTGDTNPDKSDTENPGMKRGPWQGKGSEHDDQQGDNPKPGQQGEIMDICSRLSDLENKFIQKISQGENSEDRFAQWKNNVTQHDSKLAELRAEWDANRNAQFSKLEEKATTEAQKKAVSDFETIVKDAIAKRRAAVDVALEAFRSGVKDLINSRTEGASTDKTALIDAIHAAFEAAKSNCSDNTKLTDIKTILKKSIQAAREKFMADKKNTPKVGEGIQALIDARKEAVGKALADFKATMEKARTDLKKAFPKDSE